MAWLREQQYFSRRVLAGSATAQTLTAMAQQGLFDRNNQAVIVPFSELGRFRVVEVHEEIVGFHYPDPLPTGNIQ